MPAWLDNGFHSHGKRELVSCSADGLLARALSRSSDLLTDGFVEASWAEKQLRPAERKRVVEELVTHGLFEALPAGESRVVRGRPRAGLRKVEASATVGPFVVDGYVVHDYLDCNRSRAEVEARREAEAKKKRGARAKGRQEQLETPAEVAAKRRDAWDGVGDGSLLAGAAPSPVSPGESPLFFGGDSRDRDLEREVPSQGEGLSDHAGASARPRSKDPKVQAVLDVLAQAPRLHINAVGVENAIMAWPNSDPMRAAHEAVALATDPAYRITNAAGLLVKQLEKQVPAPDVFGDRRPRGDRGGAAAFQALKGAVA